jgi:hypothetical protein
VAESGINAILTVRWILNVQKWIPTILQWALNTDLRGGHNWHLGAFWRR